MLSVLIVRLGFESYQDSLNFFFFFLAFVFLKQSFKKGLNIKKLKNTLSIEDLKQLQINN